MTQANVIQTDARTQALFTRRELLLGALAASTGLPMAGCGGGAELALFAPFFTFQFEGVSGRDIFAVNFQVQSTSDEGRSGVFDPDQSSMSANQGAARSNFSGSFNQRNLTMNLSAPTAPLAAGYTGVFVDNDTIDLTPRGGGGGTFTVRRNNFPFKPGVSGNWVGEDASKTPWKMQLATDPPDNDSSFTVLLLGKENLGGGADSPLSGYVNVRYIALNVVRDGTPVQLTGKLIPGPSTPNGDPPPIASIEFNGGGTLRRA